MGRGACTSNAAMVAPAPAAAVVQHPSCVRALVERDPGGVCPLAKPTAVLGSGGVGCHDGSRVLSRNTGDGMARQAHATRVAAPHRRGHAAVVVGRSTPDLL